MATPQESITTVNGRRCTRSRARTSTSTLTSAADAEESTPPDVVQETSDVQLQIQSSVVEAPPPPPSSSPVASPPPSAVSTAIDTDSPASSAVQTSALANLPPPQPAAIAPNLGVDPSETGEVSSAAREISTPSPATASSTAGSGTVSAAITSTSPDPTTPIESPSERSPTAVAFSSIPFSDNQPEAPQTTGTGVPSGGEDGIIAPDNQGSGGRAGLTIPTTGATSVGGIVGGVVGGFVGIALISALLFLCLRRRKSKEPFRRWQQRMNEKNDMDRGIIVKVKDIGNKLQDIPASAGLLIAKLKGKKSGPSENPYRRHSARSSVSSVYSVRSNRRSQSISEPPSRLRQQLRGFGERMPSLKRSRTLLAQRKESLVVGSKSPFPGIVEDPGFRNTKNTDNPFADPETTKADPNSKEGISSNRAIVDGLKDQQRPPLTPKPVAKSERKPKDPFASILEELAERNGSGTPEWLRDSSHNRTQSAAMALRSHPPSTAYTASVYTSTDNPFFDPLDAPPVPDQPLPPNPPTRPSNTYSSTLPSFNATSSAASRESNGSSLLFGEPGPSRPSTNLFSNVSVMPRTGRQSDPFDLDRPEVLGYGNVSGRREVRASVTRNNSKSKRTSSIPNWVTYDDSPYEQANAVRGPLNPSAKR
ncbi:hypothetical protein CC78DRAFT_379076 [Lojkania enalia]|uniref:Uncharacterized protein n=1 Tax=Lojkania enalia TaxID=147567 RepID=A0A9P4KH07_9PLEO|nr:hypothetical protein CC78DRAFT_379076 [Didymosphaeria enalia]